MMHRFAEATRFVQEADRILVLSHLSPDGDAIGSTLAVGQLLRSLGKQVTMVNDSMISDRFHFLPDVNHIFLPKQIAEKFHYVIALDCADEERMGSCRQLFVEGARVLNIDHHATNHGYGAVNLIVPTAAATVEILFDWFESMEVAWDQQLATYVYMGLLTDTGGFRYSNTTPKVLRQAAKLVEFGAPAHELADRVLESTTVAQLELLQRALATMQLSPSGKVAWMELTQGDYETDQDVEGIVNYARNIIGVDVGILFREIDSHTVKVSLRSRSIVDVGQLAKSLGGGGHARAAGCTIHRSLADAKKEVFASLEARWGV